MRTHRTNYLNDDGSNLGARTKRPDDDDDWPEISRVTRQSEHYRNLNHPVESQPKLRRRLFDKRYCSLVAEKGGLSR